MLRAERRIWEDDLGKTLHSSLNGTAYSLKINGRWQEFRLPQGGQTHAIKVESAAVPKPKGLRKTTKIRWYYGRWQKYSDKKGYINT